MSECAISEDTDRLLDRVASGERNAWGELLTRHRDRLRCMVALRLDRRLQGRIDPSDVIQDAYVDASLQLAGYLKDRSIPFFLWLRLITGQRMVALHRHHLGTQARDAAREISIFRQSFPEASSAILAAHLLGRDTRASDAAMRAENCLRLQQALDELDPLDREVLALRHFEQLSNGEAARVLGVNESAASKRYVRALQRLKEALVSMPGGSEGL
jgi:RNA polymerase sigma-70 factor (ECF subfamily)